MNGGTCGTVVDRPLPGITSGLSVSGRATAPRYDMWDSVNGRATAPRYDRWDSLTGGYRWRQLS